MRVRGQPATVGESLGISRATIKRLLSTDLAFAEAYEDAQALFKETIEEKIMLKAFNQVPMRDEDGNIVRYVDLGDPKYDNTRALLAFAARHIDGYKPGKTEVTVSTGVIVVPPTAKSAEEWVAQHATEVTVSEPGPTE